MAGRLSIVAPVTKQINRRTFKFTIINSRFYEQNFKTTKKFESARADSMSLS